MYKLSAVVLLATLALVQAHDCFASLYEHGDCSGDPVYSIKFDDEKCHDGEQGDLKAGLLFKTTSETTGSEFIYLDVNCEGEPAAQSDVVFDNSCKPHTGEGKPYIDGVAFEATRNYCDE